MKRKFVSTVIAAFTFIAMMSVTALANPAATVRLEAGEIVDGYVEVQVHVDAAGGGVSALVVDFQYSGGAQRIEGPAAQRQFTTPDGNVSVASVAGGITPTNLFPMSFEQFIAPPYALRPDGTRPPMLLYFEMPGNDVLTTDGLAATIRLSVPDGVTGGRVIPTVHMVDGHAFAYRWEADGSYTHLTNVVSGAPVEFGVGGRLAGDINMDGIFNTADLTRARHYFAGFPVPVCEINGNVNGDDVFNTADLTRFRHYFAGFPVQII